MTGPGVTRPVASACTTDSAASANDQIQSQPRSTTCSTAGIARTNAAAGASALETPLTDGASERSGVGRCAASAHIAIETVHKPAETTTAVAQTRPSDLPLTPGSAATIVAKATVATTADAASETDGTSRQCLSMSASNPVS